MRFTPTKSWSLPRTGGNRAEAQDLELAKEMAEDDDDAY